MIFEPIPGGFLAYYDRTHQNPVNRWLHHIAHSLAVAGVLTVIFRPWFGLFLLLIAFPVSWSGHHLFEKNTPAFFVPPAHGGWVAVLIRKAQIALGGVVWSAVSLWRGTP